MLKLTSMFKKIITADNTETFLNTTVGESYHSQTGAVEEALKKYALPCNIKELAKTGKIRILDVCFGLGYNSAMAIDIALKENPNCSIEVIGLENDSQIISQIQNVNPPIDSFRYYKRLTSQSLEFKEGKVSVKVLLGDARECVKELSKETFDAVFFDPFSPKTAPEMWYEDFFKQVFRVMKNSGVLATYTCARMARENMSKAGFFWNDGPIVGRRGPGTIATKWV
jgi:tRNA U34 5-methylaminomethyl-2-thiouridine-forming methyltransferase MnmC